MDRENDTDYILNGILDTGLLFNTYSHELAFSGESRLYITELSMSSLVSYTLAMKHNNNQNVALVIYFSADRRSQHVTGLKCTRLED